MKKLLISLCFVFFVAQSNCSNDNMLTLTNIASTCGAGFLADQAIKNGKLNPKIATIAGFSTFAFDCLARKFAPNTMKNIGMKLGLSTVTQEFLAKFSPFISAATFGVGLTGVAWWIHAKNKNILFEKIWEDDFQGTQQLLYAGADVNAVNSLGNTALISTISRSHTRIAQLLIEHGSNVNTVDNHGNTALIEASSRGLTYIVQRLLAAGADVNLVSNNGRTAASEAYINGHHAIAELLIGRGAHGNSINGKNIILIEASYRGITGVVQQLLTSGANVDAADDQGKTALMHAIFNNHADIVQLLLNASVNINAADNEGNTALIQASARRNTNIVRLLLNANAHVNLMNNSEKTALHYAIEAYFRDSSHIDLVRLLIEKDAHIPSYIVSGTTVLHRAYTLGDIQTVNLLIEHGVDVNIAEQTYGATLLHVVCSRGDSGIVQRLLNAGADVNAVNNRGETALIIASTYGHTDVVQQLLSAGANINAINLQENTPLMQASAHGHENIVQLLLTAGAHINVVNNAQKSALSLALIFNYKNIIELLIQNGADANVTRDGNYTALMWATYEGYTDIIHRLLIAGVNVNAINNEGKTALHYAIDAYSADNASVDIIRLLIEHSTNIPSYIVNGTTILHRTYTLEDNQTFNLLLEHGADVNIPDLEHGATLLHMACSRGDNQTVQLLLNHGASISAVDVYGKSPEDIARELNHSDIADVLAKKGNIEKDCKVCFDSYPTRNFVRLHCGHDDTCKSCMLEITNTNIQKRSLGQLACTAHQCQDKHFTAADLRSISGHQNIALHKEYQEKINYLSTLEWIRTQANGKGCPSPDCKYAFLAAENPETIECPECHAEYCSQCLHDHPSRWTCAQAKDVRESEGQGPEAAASARFLAEHTKPCPKCNAPTEKIDGCNHMTCDAGSCNSHFCFMCGSTLESPYYRSAAVDGTLLCGCPTWPQSPASSS